MSQSSWTESIKVTDLAEQIGQGFGVLDTSGTIQYANNQLAQILGYSREDLVGIQFETLQGMKDGLKTKLGLAHNNDIILATKSGLHISAKITILPLDSFDRGWYILVSELKDDETLFTPQFVEAIEHASPLMMVIDSDCKIQYVNRNPSHTSASSVVGLSALIGVEEPYRESMKNAIDAVFEEGIIGTIEISESHPDKPTQWFVLRISPIKQGNTVVSVVVTSTNITDRIVASNALKESEERFRGIFDNAADAILLTDELGHVSDLNTSFEQLFGVEKRHILGKPIWDVQASIMANNSRSFKEQQATEKALKSFFEKSDAPWIETITNSEFVHPVTGKHVWFEQQSIKIPTHNGHKLCAFAWNVTKRVEEEEARKRSEKMYKALFEQNNDAIILLDLEGKHIDANEQALVLLGYSLDELIEIDITHTVSDSEIEESHIRFNEILTGKKLPIYERTLRKKSGEHVIVDINVSLVRDDNGKPLHIQSIMRDITEKKRTLEFLKENEERLKLALHGADLGVWDWDTERDELKFNERYTSILGFEPEDFGTEYSKWTNLVHPDDLDIVEERWNAHVMGETPFYSSEHRMKTKSGEYKWILERGKVIEHTAEGRTKRASGTILDITERILAEQALRVEEAKYKTIVEQSLIGIAILPAGPVNIAFANSKLGTMLGYSHHELEMMNTEEITSLICEDDQESLRNYLRNVIRNESTSDTIEICMNKKDAETIWIELSAGRIEYNNQSAVLVSFVDNTKRREMENGLRLSEAKGRMLLQSLKDLVIVHDEFDNYSEVYTGNADQLYVSPNELIGHHISEILPEGISETYLKNVRSVRESGKHISMDYPLEINNETRWFSATISPHEDGKSVVVVIRDITARFAAEETLRRDRRIFHQLAQSFIQVKDIDEVTEVILKELASSYGFDYGLFSQYDPTSNVLRRTATVGAISELITPYIELSKEEADSYLITHIYKSKIAMFISDIDREVSEKSYLAKIRGYGAKSVMAAPVLDDDNNVLAVYSFATSTTRSFDAGDFEVFSTITNMLGSVLKRRNAEEQKQKVQDRLERERRAFQSIANSAVLATDTSELSTQIIRGLIDSLGFDFGTLRLYDEKEEVLRPTAIVGIEPTQLSSIVPTSKDKEPQHLVSYAAIKEEQIIASDVSSNPITLKFKDRLDTLKVKSVVVWPIKNEIGHLVGVLSLGSYEPVEIPETTRPFFNAVSGMLNTVIERKETEQALLISERRYRELLTDISEGIGIADLNERLVFVNQALAEMLGYEPEELVGRSLLDLVDPDEIQLIVRQTTQRKEGTASSYTHSFIRKNGSKRYVRVSAVPSRDDQGNVDGSVAIITDITERLQAEAAVKESESRFRNIFHSSPIGMHLIEETDDGQLILIDTNPAVDKLLKSDHDDLCGRPLSYIMKNLPSHKNVLEEYHNVIRTGRAWSSEDIRYEDNKIQSAMQIQAFRTSGRTMVVSFLDATEQMIAQQALKESEALFRSIFETTPVGMHLVEFSDDGNLVLNDTNPAAVKIEEKSGRQRFVIGETPRYEIAGIRGQEVINRFQDILRTGQPWNLEDVFYNEKGVAIGAVQLQIFRATPRTIVTSFLDISERYVAEKQIRELNEELARRVEERTAELAAANKELEAFAYSVSHDLRAPLRSIDGFSKALLEDYFDIIDETGRDYLNRVRSGATKMAALIEDILSLSRITRSDMVRSEVNLSELVRAILKDMNDADSEREINLRINEVISARCDPRLIRIVLQNLIDNAWKFTRPVESPTITFGSMEIDGRTTYFVQDNGAGFDMKYKDKLFTPFQRLHSSGEFEGSGIGLATVQRIINKHGGQIWAESSLNEGSTFYFTLPE